MPSCPDSLRAMLPRQMAFCQAMETSAPTAFHLTDTGGLGNLTTKGDFFCLDDASQIEYF